MRVMVVKDSRVGDAWSIKEKDSGNRKSQWKSTCQCKVAMFDDENVAKSLMVDLAKMYCSGEVKLADIDEKKTTNGSGAGLHEKIAS